VRVEFWGDEVDSLSSFDMESQRRTESIPQVTLAPCVEVIPEKPAFLAQKIEKLAASLRGKNAPKAKEVLRGEAEKLKNGLRIGSMDKFISLVYPQAATLFDYFPPEDSLLFFSEGNKLKERVRTTLWQWGEDVKSYLAEGLLCKGLDQYSQDWEYALGKAEETPALFLDLFARGSYEIPTKTLVNMTAKQLSPWGGGVELLAEDLRALLDQGRACAVLTGTERAGKALAEDLKRAGLPAAWMDAASTVNPGTVVVTLGALSAGFELPEANFALITHGRMTEVKRKRVKRDKNSKEISSLSELAPGDYVVHATHGIGLFEGIHKLEMNGVTKDYIKVRYAKNDTLYVPVTQLDLVSKYIGPREDSAVKLSRLGGADWQRQKTKVRKAVKDIAKELIQLYAQRMQQKGFAFPPDGEWQRDFESHFEYDETEDQLRCISEIKDDMEREVPMDRLLCGDVGFGKTEVALRAAFKCVTAGKQCAILVPTTILAWQHYQTILRRMEGFPVDVELLSRFRSPRQQDEILRKVRRGSMDIVVGTHRLVSKDVKFHDLGLVIIDEEQRFGVAQKEKLKQMCSTADVLTLSATPIPRTLNMALSGIRDMSVIEEAPHDRHPVQTYVLEYDTGVIGDAIRRELRRGGQVYYLHNDVASLQSTVARIQQMAPEARIGVGHGKMNEEDLSEVWRQLLDHEIDVLVCTTIIETGVDVPSANTLIIENADRMGLSQLHQLRGRVGRSNRRAYAYLTYTPNKALSEIAQKRLSAIREFTEFGSGFKIAMRDLEIRGAGNILGGEQHGHMEAVGYDMYVKLLNEAVSLMKGEEPTRPVDQECLVDLQVQAHIPESYIDSLSLRLDVYRRIAEVETQEDAMDVLDELIDRFGEPPASVKGLLDVALLRNTAAGLGVTEVKQQGDSLLVYKEKFDVAEVGPLIKALGGRVLLSAGSKPYISVKMAGQPPTQALSEILTAMQENAAPKL
ncbi:MAG: transcription-repair coupling factor, partial [Acutalibacter sp.]